MNLVPKCFWLSIAQDFFIRGREWEGGHATMKSTILFLCSFSTQIILLPSLGGNVNRNDGCWTHTGFLWWKMFLFSAFHADVMLKECVCSHFLPTLCTLLPLSQVEVRIEARAFVLRPPRVVGLVPPVQRQAWWIVTGEEKTLDVAEIVFFLPPPTFATTLISRFLFALLSSACLLHLQYGGWHHFLSCGFF